jgi:hypothetical protein
MQASNALRSDYLGRQHQSACRLRALWNEETRVAGHSFEHRVLFSFGTLPVTDSFQQRGELEQQACFGATAKQDILVSACFGATGKQDILVSACFGATSAHTKQTGSIFPRSASKPSEATVFQNE